MRTTEQSSERIPKAKPACLLREAAPMRGELNPTFVSHPGETLSELMDRIDSEIRGADAEVVSQEVFLSHRELFDPDILHRVGYPLTWIIEDRPRETQRVQSRVWARTGGSVRHLSLGDEVCGSVLEDESCCCLRLGGLIPASGGASPSEQTRAVLELMEEGLNQVGMDFGHVVRTWFFNEDILSWYPDFNRVRNEFFRSRQVFEGMVPASTGIGGGNPFCRALTAGLLAIRHKSAASSSYAVPSPLQNSALDYGSSFSRAVEIATPESRRLLVSGTASIGTSGETLHENDFIGQVDRTFEVVREILNARGMDWSRVVRAQAYLRDPLGEGVVRRKLNAWGLEGFPLLMTAQTICRENLLFEIELDAFSEVNGDSL